MRFPAHRLFLLCARLTVAFLILFTVRPQLATAQLSTQADRVAAQPDLTKRVRLTGHVPGWASAANDAGMTDVATPLHLTFVLTRASERQAAFAAYLADQQNPSSPSFHHWLTPEQIGEQYGPTQHDVDALTSWIAAQGLSVRQVSLSRMFVEVDGLAGVAAKALGTSFHQFKLPQGSSGSGGADESAESKGHIAPTSEPELPAAFSPLVLSISGLSDPMLRPMAHFEPGSLHASSSERPEYTNGAGSHFVTPGDFATIFDLNPVYSSGINGTGQKVAIIGRSRIVSTDISEFEANTGLAANLPNTIIPTTGVDPGISTTDEGEALLDVVRVIGTAPGVQADLIVSGTAGGYNGIFVAAQYEVNTVLDPVMNISFGSCEVYSGPSGVNLWDTLFAQAAAEGISVFVSAADSGAASCDTQFGTPGPYQFRSINYICSSSYATCVGATEYADFQNPAQYWSSTNTASRVSALSYIPEGAWNEPSTTNGTTGAVTYVAASGGGGASLYVTKPAWQTGLGVPADMARDVPDVSFPGAAHDGYYACYASAGGDCSTGHFEYFSGTSAAAPTMAAITALLNQKTGSQQGNMNPLLYRLAAQSPSAFHDATPATSGVSVCDVSTASMCNNSTPTATGLSGGLAGFSLTTGYDQATGLGSLEVNNFLTAAAGLTAKTLAPTKLAVTSSVGTISDGGTASFVATLTSSSAGTPGGSVQFYADDAAIGTAVAVAGGKATSGALPFPAAGNYLITAVYSGDANFATTTAPGVPLDVLGAVPTVKLSAANASITAGGATSFTVALTGMAGLAAPTGLVRFYNSVLGYFAVMPLVNGSATTGATSFSTAGSSTVTAYYLGDAVYSPGNGSTSLVVNAPVPAYQIALSPASLAVSAGASSGNTATVNITESNGFVGVVNLSCGVAYNGTGTPTYPPTCGLASSAVSVNAAAASTVLTITTTVPHGVRRGGAARLDSPLRLPGGLRVGAALSCLMLCVISGRRVRGRVLMVVFGLLAFGGVLCGCGGSSAPAPAPAPVGTSTGSYTVTVTGSSTVAGVATPTAATLTLTVN